MPPSEQDPKDRAIQRVGDDEGREGVDIEDVDLQALAEQVYALLRQELRLERERQGGGRIW